MTNVAGPQIATTTASADDPEFRIHYRRAVVTSAGGWALDGFDYTMFSLCLAAILSSLSLDVAWGGTISTVSLMASAVGGMAGGALADRFGRVRVLCWVIVAFSVFTALTATAQNLPQLLLWRTLEGLAFGAEWPVGVALLAEYASQAKRGRVMAFMQGAYSIGFAASTLCYFVLFSVLPEDQAWRAMFLVGILPALSVLVIRRKVKDRVTHTEHVGASALIRRLWRPDLRRTTVLSTLFMMGQHGTYYSLIAFLPLYLQEERGLPVTGTAVYTWIFIVGSFIGYISSGWFHDRFGRRPTFTGTYLGIVVTLLAFLLVETDSLVIGYSLIFVLGVMLSGAAGGLGAFLAELFPTSCRGAGVGFAYDVGRGIGALGPMVIGLLAESLTLGIAIAVVGLTLNVLAALMLWQLPETRGRELIEAP